MNEADLTILLTLKGRHLHTLRWMWHANRLRLPFKVIVADGDVHPAVDKVLSNPSLFPHLEYQYRRYCDRSFSDFYKKCAEAIQQVQTKYVMMSDNDDFVISTGVRECIGFLENSPGFACAGGQIPGFSVKTDQGMPNLVLGRMADKRFGYPEPPHDNSFPSVADRVFEEIDHHQVVYYNVYRTQYLRTIYEEIVRHDFSDLTVHEYYCALRTVTLGNVRMDPSVICYLRQAGTSSISTYWVDWVHHLLRSKVPQDFRSMAAAIADTVASQGGGDSAEFAERILNAFAWKLRHMLAHSMLRHRFPALYALKQNLTWLSEIRLLPESFLDWRTETRFWRNFAADCPDRCKLAEYQAEFKEIETSLTSDDLLDFLKTHLPELVSIP